MRPSLVVLAAGTGVRYGGPKQLAPVGPNGEALLEYAAYDARQAHFGRVVVVVRPEQEREFRDRLEVGLGRRMPLAFVHQRLGDLPAERTRPWGTGHAVLAAEPEIDGPFAVLNADDLFDSTAMRTVAEFLADPGKQPPLSLALVGFPVAATLSDAGPVSRAACVLDSEGYLTDIFELEAVRASGGRIVHGPAEAPRKLGADQLVSMNLWAFPRGIFAPLRDRFEAFLARHGASPEAEYFLPDAIGESVRAGVARVRVLSGGTHWCGLTYRDDGELVRRRIEQRIEIGAYPRRLWS